MDIQQRPPEAQAVATRAPRRGRASRREQAVIQAEIRRLALALRHTTSPRADTARPNDDPGLYQPA
jgi:hypothetical protein